MDALVALLQDPKTGVSVILGVMWFKEWRRAERLEAERAALIERVLNGLNAAVVAMTGAAVSIDNMKDIVSASIENQRGRR